MPHTILLVDDEVRLADVTAVALEDLGYRVRVVDNAAAALAILEDEPVDLLLTDLRMPGMSGHELMLAAHRLRPQLPVVVMTAYSSVKDAVQVIKEGAFDYVGKPFEIDDLDKTLRHALRLSDALASNERLRAELEGRYRFEQLVGASPSFRRVIESVAEVCESRANVLLTGESGTGKEMVARAIHYNSPRKDGPFVALNCAAIPEGLLESELFGHVKGAFTGALAGRDGRFAQADGGTLFLDEIGDMPLPVQVKILRVVQERAFEPVGSGQTRQVDVRLVAATNKDLQEAVRQGAFRDDLYYRLNVFPIHLPALRDRAEDIPALANHFLQTLGAGMGKKLDGFTAAALKAMTDYAWPGNIRELQNCIERGLILAKERLVDVQDLPRYLFVSQPQGTDGPRFPLDLDEELARIERETIVAALNRCDGVQVSAAQILGISSVTLWRRLKYEPSLPVSVLPLESR